MVRIHRDSFLTFPFALDRPYKLILVKRRVYPLRAEPTQFVVTNWQAMKCCSISRSVYVRVKITSKSVTRFDFGDLILMLHTWGQRRNALPCGRSWFKANGTSESFRWREVGFGFCNGKSRILGCCAINNKSSFTHQITQTASTHQLDATERAERKKI